MCIALAADLRAAWEPQFALRMQMCGDVTTLQYITIGTARAAAEQLTGQPVATPVPASAPRDPRTAPRARPVPRAAAVPPEALDADLHSAAGDPGAAAVVPAAAAVSSPQPRAVQSQHDPAERLGPGSEAPAQPATGRETSSKLLPLPANQTTEVGPQGLKLGVCWDIQSPYVTMHHAD